MWRKLLALPAPQRRLLGEAAWRLLAARAALWLRPRTAIGPARSGGPQRPASDPTATDLVTWAVGAVARRLPAPFRTCLPQAMAVSAMLRRRGIPARLVIGVRRAPTPSPIEAHAWVESGGRVILGAMDDLASFVPLEVPPGAALAGAARHQ